MRYIFPVTLYVSGILAIYFGLQYWFSKEKKHVENRLFARFCFASALWSLGFGILLSQDNADIAHFGRIIGMIGTFLYLIFAQMLVGQIADCSSAWRKFSNGVAYIGVGIYFFTVQREQIDYYPSVWGMTYSFKTGIGNTLYTLYCVIVAVDILVTIIYMIRGSKLKRVQAFGKKMLWVLALIVYGMILDTIFPLVGLKAIPGSTITQFFGVIVIHYAISELSRSRINITNMSEFIYSSLSVPVLVYNVERRLEITNDAAASFLGLNHDNSGSAMIPIYELFEIDEDEVFIFDGKRRDVDVVCHRNQVFCSLAVNKIQDHYGDNIGYIIIVTDLSERIKTMQQLEEAKKEADAANQAKSTFLANMSHEIRTPMNVIIGFSELILKMEIEGPVREYVGDIKESSENLLAIINDLLDISKIESGKMELVCTDYYIGGMFQDVFLIINAQAKKKGLDFRLTVDPAMPNKLFGDKIRIRGVLINLLNNAVKYTREGSVSMEARVVKTEGDIATLEFKVIDTGVGIREEEQGTLFESFSQVDRKVHYGVEGTGLGLAIVKGYVALMNGDVTVTSEYGKGSIFTAVIEQKIVDASPMDKFNGKEVRGAEDFKMGSMKILGTRVLIVDDNQINLRVASSTLGYYGLTVDTASSGMEAIECCRNHKYQMVFMDQMMPQMDGVEAMHRIRELDAHYAMDGECKIIVLTANAVAGVREQLLSAGFDEYLGKPMNFKQLERLFVRFLPEEQIQLCRNEDECGRQLAQTAGNPAELRELGDMLQVEVDQGIAFCGGRLEDYLKVLQLTYHNGQPQLDELRKLQEQQNYGDYTIKIHGMKSTSLSIGAREVSELAKAQELAGKEGNYNFIDAHMEEFQQEYGRLLERMRSVLERYNMLEAAQEALEDTMLTEEGFGELLVKILKCLDGFDFPSASKLIRETPKERVPEQHLEDFANLERWMDEMEEDKIRELIEKVLA